MEEQKYFNVKIQFDKEIFDNTIASTIQNGGKGYVCVIESNNLTVANNVPQFMEVVNNSLINSCDGSVIAKMLGHIHGKDFDSYIGTDIFTKYTSKKEYTHYFLGNTPEILQALKEALMQKNETMGNMQYKTLPFATIDQFDYQGIAQDINKHNPDFIWVSLGAPKQEFFMSRLEPFLNRGVMFGVGAAFNFVAGVGNVKRAPKWMLKLRLEWLFRAFNEPRKNVPRYWGFIKILPKLIRSERRKVSISKSITS